MKNKFCPRCGKETEDLVEGLCEDCFQEKEELFVVPEIIEVNVCKRCGRYKEKGEWKDGDLEEFLKKLARQSLDSDRELSIEEIELREENQGYKARIKAKGKKIGMEEAKGVEFRINYGICNICSKISSGYFNTTLQLRGPEKKLERALRVCEEIFDSAGNREDFVSDVRKVRNGYDLYLSSKSLARKMVKQLTKRFETEKKSSRTLYGEKDGKRIYRSTYLVRILPQE
ncbi:MAG: NMD3-related protein [Candidatus Aenigmatarchaeota archaeon]